MAVAAGSLSGGSIRLEGAKELEKALIELERKVARKIISSSLRDGAKIVQQQAKANAPVLTGLTRKKIVVRAAKKRRSETAAIAVRTGEGAFKGKTFYASFIEFGWNKAPVIRTRAGRFISISRKDRKAARIEGKKIPGTHFMQRAFQAKSAQAAKTIVNSMRQKIELAAKEK